MENSFNNVTNFFSSKDSKETRTINTKSNNIKTS